MTVRVNRRKSIERSGSNYNTARQQIARRIIHRRLVLASPREGRSPRARSSGSPGSSANLCPRARRGEARRDALLAGEERVAPMRYLSCESGENVRRSRVSEQVLLGFRRRGSATIAGRGRSGGERGGRWSDYRPVNRHHHHYLRALIASGELVGINWSPPINARSLGLLRIAPNVIRGGSGRCGTPTAISTSFG